MRRVILFPFPVIVFITLRLYVDDAVYPAANF